jgi:hypothetical protein
MRPTNVLGAAELYAMPAQALAVRLLKFSCRFFAIS